MNFLYYSITKADRFHFQFMFAVYMCLFYFADKVVIVLFRLLYDVSR